MSNSSTSDEVKKKQLIGVVAVAFLLAFTILGFLGYFSWFVWVIADLIVAGVANLLLRRISRKSL
jgi:hypothetical protein